MPWFFTLYLETLARKDLPHMAHSGIGTSCALGLSDHSLAAPLLVHPPVRLPGEMEVVLPTLPLLKLLGFSAQGVRGTILDFPQVLA